MLMRRPVAGCGVSYEPKVVIVAANEVHGRHYARAHGISQMRAIVVTPANVAMRLRGLRDVEVRHAPGWGNRWSPAQVDVLNHQLAIVEFASGVAE